MLGPIIESLYRNFQLRCRDTEMDKLKSPNMPSTTSPTKRRVIQIAGSDNRLYALCDDYTVWEMNHSGMWCQHPEIPQPQAVEVKDPRQMELPGVRHFNGA